MILEPVMALDRIFFDARYIRWDHWLNIDKAERALGESQNRERVKLFERQEMISIGRGR